MRSVLATLACAAVLLVGAAACEQPKSTPCPPDTTRPDTVTVWVRDTVTVVQRDTVYREVVRVDTLYVTVRDTVAIEVPRPRPPDANIPTMIDLTAAEATFYLSTYVGADTITTDLCRSIEPFQRPSGNDDLEGDPMLWQISTPEKRRQSAVHRIFIWPRLVDQELRVYLTPASPDTTAQGN